MQKYVSFVLVFILLFALTACTSPNTNSSSTKVNAEVPTTSAAPLSSAPTTAPIVGSISESPTIHTFDGPLTLAWTQGQTTVAGMTAEYGWVCYDGRIFLKQYTGDYDLGIIPGSERYICASASSMAGVYLYLVDVQTGAVSDPLTALDLQIRERITDVIFSADGTHALVLSHSSTVATLLECETGESISLSADEDVYSIWGCFIDSAHILLAECFEKESGQYSFTFALYSIPADTYTAIPGEYQTKDRSSEDFIAFTEEGMVYTFCGNQLAIIDPLTWKKTVLPFGNDATLSYYTSSTCIVSAEGVQYLLHKNGTYKPISDD